MRARWETDAMTQTLSDAPEGYLSGFGNHSRPRRCPGALPEGRNSPQRAPLGCTPSSCRARPSPRRATRTGARGCIVCGRQRQAPPYSPFAQGSWCAPALRRGRRRRPTGCAGIPCPCPTQPTDWVEGLVTYGGNGDADGRGGHRHAPLCRQPLDDGPGLLRRRRRAADRAAGRATWSSSRRWAASRPRPARSWSSRAACASGSSCRTAGPRLCLRELRRAVPPAGPGADRLQRPGQSARLPDAGRRVRGRRPPDAVRAEIPRAAVGHAPSTTRRWTWSPGTATTRRTNTTGAVQHDRHGQLRPPGPVDLHRPDRPSTRRARPTATSSSSRRAGWWPRTPSGRRGSTATS